MDSKVQKSVEDQNLKSKAGYSTSLNLTSVPATDISTVSCFLEKCYPSFTPVSDYNVLEFNIPASSLYYTQLNDSYLYLRLRCVDKDNKVLGTASKCAPTNGIFSALFSNIELQLNGVNITNGSNMYSYAAHIQRLLSCDESSKNKLLTEHYYPESSETDVSASSDTYKALLKLNKDHVFECYSKIYSGLFNCDRLISPNISIKIRMRLSNPSFYLLDDDPASGQAYTNKIQVLDSFLDLKRQIINSRVSGMHEQIWNKGQAFKFPITDFDCTSFTVPTGSLTFTSESLFSFLPNVLVLGLVSSKAFTGTPSKSPFRFNHFSLNSASALVNSEQYYFVDPKLNIDEKQFLRTYRHLLNINDGEKENTNISIDQFTKQGLCLIPLVYHSNQASKFKLEKESSIKIQLSFKTATTDAINAIIFYSFPKLISVSKTQVYVQ